jgi:hypothetical protein
MGVSSTTFDKNVILVKLNNKTNKLTLDSGFDEAHAALLESGP